MNGSSLFVQSPPCYGIVLPLVFVGFICCAPPSAYTQVDDAAKTEAVAAVATRIERARALAAAHQLVAAATELESLRTTAQDDVVRNVTSVMLMSIYLEEGNYARAESLLEEAFRSRSAEKDRSIHTYFALAGQAVNGARSHLERYRSFGINVSDAGLPSEASSDLDRLRSLLERMIAQAKEITSDNSKAHDSLALLEDILGIRLSLARDNEDREKWENAYAGARQGLASSRTQIASLGGIPSKQPPVEKGSAIAGNAPSVFESPQEAAGQPKAADANRDQSSRDKQSLPEALRPASSDSSRVEVKAISTGSLNQRAAKRVVPTYPQTAKAAGAEGLVRVYVTIDEGGKVMDITHSEGPILLKQAAEDAARQWRFHPTIAAGKSVRLAGFIEFNFKPE